ncbi:molybdate ABC transporter permease subunit [Aquibacillus albus]|uniref:Molybdenum transport system permease n=1 Tax=Aquibacillus albus TaxID=1168171 RepID=A0ABS2MYJ3_9BACI|nr:molybdate ABC transporter permease subunit [Aquibacillus albus]MBM7570947.1 molybdate transport system permease protein [Aquibacillus albus]
MGWSWFPVQLSFFVAFVATIITAVIAIIAAYFLVANKRKLNVVMETIFFLPLVLPPTVIGFMLIVVFGKNSPIGRAMEWIFGQSLLFTATAAIIAAVVVAFPLLYQTVKTGFTSLDDNVLGAAKVDGASEWKLLLFIMLPLSIRSITAGLVLGFTRAFGEFGATLMFAGNIPGKTQTIPTAIYIAIESGQTAVAWYYALISVTVSFLLLFIINQLKVDR